jgi:Tfp pilus assembly protein PilO
MEWNLKRRLVIAMLVVAALLLALYGVVLGPGTRPAT